jgi:hypothetical protein
MPAGFADSCLDSTGQFVFALGSEICTYVLNGKQTGEYMPNVEVYPVGDSTASGVGTFNFPIEDTPMTGIQGVRIACRPVTSAALAVYGVTNAGSGKYDSFATVWDPVGGQLGTTPTVYLHGAPYPTLVTADPNYAYFAGGGTLYEHVASTFALNGSLAASGSTDLLATAGEVFLVGASSLTCYTP